MRARLVADWWAAEQVGSGDNIMVAVRRADVGEHNDRARALRVVAGDVTGPTLALSTGELAVGDRVVTTRNRRSLGVVNGSRGVVVAVDERQRSMRVHLDGRRRDEPGHLTVLSAEYLEAGHLSHGYAITGHKAQGMTADRAFVLGDEAIYREWGYVALSRGRAENQLYVVAAELNQTDDTEHGRMAASPLRARRPRSTCPAAPVRCRTRAPSPQQSDMASRARCAGTPDCRRVWLGSQADASHQLMRRGGLFAPMDAVEVIRGLHMRAAPSRRAARALARAGISYAVDLREDRARALAWPSEVQTFSCPLAEYQAPDLDALQSISGQIASLIQSGAIVYVHCRAGVQRAPMVACAVLVQMGWTLSDAFRLVSSRRAVASMSEAQLDALKAVEASMRPLPGRLGHAVATSG